MTNLKHGLDADELCDTHLRSAHGEAHQLVGSILAGMAAQTRGHVDAGDAYPALLVERHAELAREHQRRGGHHTPGHKGEFACFAAAVAVARHREPDLFDVEPDDERLRELRRRHFEACDDCYVRAGKPYSHSVSYQRQQARDLRAGEHRRRVIENVAGRRGA